MSEPIREINIDCNNCEWSKTVDEKLNGSIRNAAMVNMLVHGLENNHSDIEFEIVFADTDHGESEQ